MASEDDDRRPGGTFRAALRHGHFRDLLAGFAISTAGDWLYSVALLVFIYEETRSAAWVSAASVLRLLPFVLFSAVAGAVADRNDRRRVMLASDISRGALMFMLAGLTLIHAPIVLVVTIVFLATAAGTPYGPAVQALLPALVGEDDLAPANAATTTVEEVATVLGPMLGGVLLVAGSAPAAAFALNGVTFLLSALFVRRLPGGGAGTEEGEQEPGLLSQLRAGVGVIRRSGDISTLIAIVAGAAYVYGLELVLLVLVAEELLGIGAEGVAFLSAAVGVGGMAAAAIVGRLARSPRQGHVLAVAVLLLGAPLMLLPFAREPGIAYALMTIEGAGSIILEVVAVTLLQRAIDQAVTARVFGVLDSVAVGAIILGSLVAPVLVGALGLTTALVVAGATMPVLVLALAAKLRRLGERARVEATDLAPRVALLQRAGIFAGASTTALEAIARSMTRLELADGSDVVREGDVADAFYVVEDGELTVRSRGEQGERAVVVNALGPGDYFGEIGLLERIPRTATVTTDSLAVVWEIPAEHFLNAINHMPVRSGTLLDGVVGRLARTHPTYEPAIATGGVSEPT